jgi:hypothetical protein
MKIFLASVMEVPDAGDEKWMKEFEPVTVLGSDSDADRQRKFEEEYAKVH